MRVLMFPGSGNKNENQFITILVNALRRRGVDVAPWNHHFSLQKGDVFHVHWPDVISDIYLRPHQAMRGRYIARLFFSTIRRVKRSGGKIIWTVHDIAAHKPAVRNSSFHQSLMKKFVEEVDVGIALTPSGVDRARAAISALRNKPFFVCPHPHYRELFGEGAYDQSYRAQLGVKPSQKVLGFLGTMRANKRADCLVRSFVDLDPAEFFLIIAGTAEQPTLTEIRNLLNDRGNYLARFEHIPENELLKLYQAIDYLVFPAKDEFTSATSYTSLSLNVPVIAYRNQSNVDLQNVVGERWLHLYEGELSGTKIIAAVSALTSRSDGVKLDLSAFDSEACADAHVAAYSSRV